MARVTQQAQRDDLDRLERASLHLVHGLTLAASSLEGDAGVRLKDDLRGRALEPLYLHEPLPLLVGVTYRDLGAVTIEPKLNLIWTEW